jgi:hypothetical protein
MYINARSERTLAVNSIHKPISKSSKNILKTTIGPELPDTPTNIDFDNYANFMNDITYKDVHKVMRNVDLS